MTYPKNGRTLPAKTPNFSDDRFVLSLTQSPRFIYLLHLSTRSCSLLPRRARARRNRPTRPPEFFSMTAITLLLPPQAPRKAVGSVTLYGSGFALLSPLPADGTPATANPFTQSTPTDMPGFGVLDVFTIFIDQTTDVVPDFMGLTSGAVGLGQINFVVPPLTSGTHEIQIKQVSHLISPFLSTPPISASPCSYSYSKPCSHPPPITHYPNSLTSTPATLSLPARPLHAPRPFLY